MLYVWSVYFETLCQRQVLNVVAPSFDAAVSYVRRKYEGCEVHQVARGQHVEIAQVEAAS